MEDSESLARGPGVALWDGSTRGSMARSGMYFIRLEAGGRHLVRSVVLVR